MSEYIQKFVMSVFNSKLSS